MVYWARVKSSLSFGIVARKYTVWYGMKNMNPTGHMVCKFLTNMSLHTFRGMIGYCLKYIGAKHFDVARNNISDEDIVEGKTLHAIYEQSEILGIAYPKKMLSIVCTSGINIKLIGIWQPLLCLF